MFPFAQPCRLSSPRLQHGDPLLTNNAESNHKASGGRALPTLDEPLTVRIDRSNIASTVRSITLNGFRDARIIHPVNSPWLHLRESALASSSDKSGLPSSPSESALPSSSGKSASASSPDESALVSPTVRAA